MLLGHLSSSVTLQEMRILSAGTQGSINPEAQGREPTGAGNVSANLSIREHFGFRYWEEGYR